MSHATEKIRSGNEPVWIVEMDVDECTLTYGVGACTAVLGTTGTKKCFNARAGCQDPTNYDGGGANVHTLRFCQARANMPIKAAAMPNLLSVDISPTTIAPGEGLGKRGSVTMTFKDTPHNDIGLDQYIADRSYTPYAQGTFWGKFKSRHPYYQGRIVRIKSGYINDPIDLTNDFVTRTYMLEKITGPDANDVVTVVAKDILKLADNERARAPVLNTGVLDADLTAVALTFNLSPAGIGAAEYSAAGTLRIGSELMDFTRVADVITVTRGDHSTTAVTHSADDLVQECLVYDDERIDDLIFDLIDNYTEVDTASYITFADWTTEIDKWLAGSRASAIITKPTGVKKLLDEICTQYMIALWWDEIDAEIKLKVYAPEIGVHTQLTDDAHIRTDSMQITDDPTRRLSRVEIYYLQRDPTEPLDEERNYRVCQVYIDADAEDTTQYGEDRIWTIHSRWIATTGDALRLGNRMLSRLRDNPRIFTWAMNMKDSDTWTGDVRDLVSHRIQDDEGASAATAVQIYATKESIGSHELTYIAEDHRFNARYGLIGPNTLTDYVTEDAGDRQTYAFISTTGPPPLMSDGTEAYAII